MSVEISVDIYRFFADIVFKKTGIFYPEKDYYRLDSRLLKLQRYYECESIQNLYHKFLTSMTPEMEIYLIDICTNNETYFFRDEKPFAALTQELIPEHFKNATNLKIWSCASSTGQEPISILMAIKEAGITLPIQIDASDISDQALEKCRKGIYTGLDVQRGLPIQLLLKYFDSLDNGEWKIKPEISSKISYAKFNLFTGIFKNHFYDIIFCRNVLIYQNQKNKEEILRSLYAALKPGGIIFMGAGESLIGIDSQLKQKVLKNGIVFQKDLTSAVAA